MRCGRVTTSLTLWYPLIFTTTVVFERFMQYGWRTIGIPRVVFGSTEQYWYIRTHIGGVASALNQAANQLSLLYVYLKKNIIEPVVQSYIDQLMYLLMRPKVTSSTRTRRKWYCRESRKSLNYNGHYNHSGAPKTN